MSNDNDSTEEGADSDVTLINDLDQRALIQEVKGSLKKELVRRASAAGNSIEELQRFVRKIRHLEDKQLFALCTLVDRNRQLPTMSLSARIEAEWDPMVSFGLNGPSVIPRPHQSYLAHPHVPVVDRPPAPPVRKGSFDESEELSGPSRENEKKKTRRLEGGALFAAVGKSLGRSFKEFEVDGEVLSLEQALVIAAEVLEEGCPVPVVVGPHPKSHLRYLLLLQTQESGTTRAFQLHDPEANDTVWVNERDLLARRELPLTDARCRRITAIAVPRLKSLNSSDQW